MKKQILPSVIATNQNELETRFKKVSQCSDLFHLDVMDGNFVKNKSLDFDFVLSSGIGKKDFEAHLMVNEPEKWIDHFADKADVIVFHFEAVKSAKQMETLIQKIKSKKKKVGIAINPETAIEKIRPYLDKVDQITVMCVHPGQYGADFLPEMQEKIMELRKLAPKLDIEVDGGVTDQTISGLNDSGANLFVSGSYIQKSSEPKKAVEVLKKKIN